MACLLVIAHAPLASSLKAVARHVYPDCTDLLHAIDVEPDATLQDIELQLRCVLGALPQPEVLVMADVFGATPCNAAVRVADGQRVRVVTGVNVPMLWRALCYAHEPLEALVARAVSGATQGVVQVAAARRQNQPHFARGDSRPHDDQDASHHQQ